MSPPIDIDGSEIQRATIDGEDVSEITIDGQQTAGFVDMPDSGLLHDYNALKQTTGSLTTVEDQKSGNDFTGDTIEVISNGINGNKSFDFDGTISMDANPANHGSSYTLHVINDSVGNIYQSGGGSSGRGVRLKSDDVSHPGVSVIDFPSSSTSGPRVASFRWDGSSAVDRIVNGNSDKSGSNISSIESPGTDSSLGAQHNDDSFYTGLVGRILVYDSDQSDADFTDTHDSLRSEWGI